MPSETEQISTFNVCLITIVLISYVQLSKAEHSCSFDYGLCSGWRQTYLDDFHWTNQYGSTPSSSTGPSSGYGGYGSYMYIETSSPRRYGDNAKLEYSASSSDVGKLSCLTFYYHMYGDTINTLNVFNGNTKVFTKSGQQGNEWIKAKVTMNLQSKVTFEGIRGTSFTGDIAIDQVSIVGGICKDCSENVNQSFGRLDIRYSSKFDPYCNWIIGNTRIRQAAAIVSIDRIYLRYDSEFVKIFDGNGKEVFSLHGRVSSFDNNFREISFGDSKNITIQVSLVYSRSYVKIDYGTLNQGLDSALLVANWNVTVVNITTRSIGISWSTPTNLFNSGVRYYVTLARKANGSSVSSTGKVVPVNTTTSEITDLEAYTEYNVSVAVVSGNGTVFKSTDVLVMTDEGVPSRAPSGLWVTSDSFTSNLLVRWNPLSPHYANGILLGYAIYYREYYYWSSYKTTNTSSPYPTRITLKDLKPGQRYRVAVAAFTSKGVGPRSSDYYATTGCASTLNETFGQVNYTSTSYSYIRCNWIIQNAGIREAIALISVQEINLHYCSEYARITDGNSNEVLYHHGCADSFAPEILTCVYFGSSNNISVQVYTGNTGRNIKINFAIVKKGLKSAITVQGWNITILNDESTILTLQWTSLDVNVNHHASFYIIEVKSIEGVLLDMETVPGSDTSADVKGLKPSTKYRLVVFGVDNTGQPYKSVETVVTTSKVFCGVRPSSTRIVGGEVAKVNSWPWQVMLLRIYGSQFCGGSLVDPYWVVTAAHCVSGKSPSSIKIRLGAHYRTYGSVGTEQDIKVAKIIVHERYNIPISHSNDIALINLATPARLGIGVGLVCLPDTSHQLPFDNVNKKCWITGWGTLSSGGSTPNTLMEASVPLVSKQRCVSTYSGEIDDSMLCAGLDDGGVDTCQGDSGGPLVCKFNGTWHLEGATSWGYGCAQARKYGVYAKIRNFQTWLSSNMYTIVPPSASPQNQSSSALVWCNFDRGLCSGWNQSSSDDFDWTLASGSTPSSSTGPSTGQGGSGKYMYIEASSPRKPGEKARLMLTVPDNGKKSCLSFYYHVYGSSAGTLNVYSGNRTIFNVSGNQGDNWVMVDSNIYLDREIVFEGIIGSSFTGDIAIDEVKVTEGLCPVSCSFDSGLCHGWSQSKSDVFDWTLRYGSTPSSGTGPSSDHGGSGKYMYIEASYWSTGDNAKLQLAVPRVESSSCLVFYYHMYGWSMGTLNVFNGNSKIFTKSGNQGYYWKKVTRTLHLSDVLTFEGIKGSSYTSDIAIDDVTVIEGNCPGCGGVLNKSSGELDIANSGDEGESNCIWTIGDAGIRQAVAIISLQRIYFGYCREYIKILHADGTEIFSYDTCQSSLPSGTSLEVPLGIAKYVKVDMFLEYRWSAVKIQYNILSRGLDSATPTSWNVTVYSITSSSAGVRWSDFPLPLTISHYLVRFKETNGVSTIYRASSYSTTYYTNRLKGYTSYDVQVFAFTTSNGNVTYSSQIVSIQTLEGVPSKAPANVRVANHGLNEFLVEWDPLPLQYTNGRLLGYSVYYKDARYYYYLEKTVNTSSPDESHVILAFIETGKRYQISVTAFTSRGHGPRSPYLYITKDCEGFVNQSSGWLNFTHTDYNTLNCSVQIRNAGMPRGVALISFQYIYFGYCAPSEYIKVLDSHGIEVYARKGCASVSSGLSVEVPFAGGHSITLAVQLSYRYSNVRVQYTILNQALSSAQLVPSWNVTITYTTSSSLTVQWSKFPLTNLTIQRFLVNYREHNSNVSLIFQTPNSYITHYSGSVLKSYRFYDVQVIAVTARGDNGTYSSQTESARTDEGVPSTAPSNVILTNVKHDEVMVQWGSIPPNTVNGILLGYRVYYREYYYYWSSSRTKTVDTSGPNVHMVILKGLKAAERYSISVAAFTSRGAGPQSYWSYITTGCGGYLNVSFGQLHIGDNRGSSYVTCDWVIGSAGISQAVAFVWIQDLYLSYYYEYLKIKNGNGSVVLNQYGYSSASQANFLEVDFGKSDNISVEIYFYRYSRLQLQYGIMKQGIQSALLIANWTATVGNTTTTSITIHWQNLMPVISKPVLHYISLLKKGNGSDVSNAVVVNGNMTYAYIAGLSTYTEYQVSVVGVSSDGQPYTSSNVTAWTEEGVPSRGPSNLQLSNLQSGEVKVQWDPLAQQYANGRIRGYSVYVYEYDYYSTLVKTVKTKSPGVHMLVLRGLKAAQRYRISVAAFTSKGVGPQTYYAYITTGCGGSLSQTFGELHVGSRSYYSSYLRCNWAISNSGVDQAVLLVSLQDLYLSYYYEYVKIIDGDGLIVFYRYGYSSSPWKTFMEVKYGSAKNVTVEIYLTYRWSRFKLRYGIVKQGLQSALPVANWSVSIGNITKTSISIQWPNLTPVLNQQVVHYFGVIKSTNGSFLNGDIISGNTSFAIFHGLSPYREYLLGVVGVNGSGQAYKSYEVTAWTEEGVPSRAPSNVSFTNVGSTEITIHWSPLPKLYANGRLLGYRVYFQKTSYYSYSVSSNASSVNVTNPNATGVILMELNPGQRYRIYVSAFTSKGEGPRSYGHYVTTACQVTTNQSVGLIDVTHTDYSTLYCHWTIGNVGVTHAVALFLFHKVDLSYCSEYVRILAGNGTVQFYQTGCWPSSHASLVEVPFGKSNNITVNIRLSRLNSLLKVQFVVLTTGLDSATLPPGWTVLVDNTTITSISIYWTNLTSLLNRHIRHYIILVNRTGGNALTHEVTDGNVLKTEINGLKHSTNYRVVVVGVDQQGRPYKTMEVNATTKNITCGHRPSSSRIVGGTVAPVNTWPWQAMLRDSSNRQFCGGTLIHPLWVVTATHCIDGKSVSTVKVELGAHYRSYGTVGTEQKFDVVQIIEHENYNTPNSWSNDIALLQLSKPAELGKGVGLACLPDNKFQLPFDVLNKTCWITGWGTLSYYGITPNELNQVAIPLVSKQRCMTSYPGKIDDSMICVGKDEGGIGGCHGDSGGPLVCEFLGKWYLEGVTSWAGMPCASPSKYTVYANTRNLKTWLISKMAGASIPTSIPATSGPVVTSCNFDYSLCSGWQQSYSDVFDWTRQSGSTSSHNTGPSSDHTSGSGSYMYIETSSPRAAGDNAKLVLSVSGNGQLSCLKFYYHMYGDTMGTLNVYSGNSLVFWSSGNRGNYWIEAKKTINLDSTVTFEGIAGSSFTGDLAIDDVSISSGGCYGQTAAPPTFFPNVSIPTSSPAVTSCNFDYRLCYGWQQSYSDVFDWTRKSGSTSSSYTGPSSDHTTGYGYYMYIETSSPRVAGDNAKLVLSVSGSGPLSCLKFYYHMYGDTMGTLTVYSGNTAVFNASGNIGNFWRKAEINICLSSTVTFEGIAGSSFTGDLAIDDVSISRGGCVGQTAAPSMCPSTSTYTPYSSNLTTPSTYKPLPTSGQPDCSDKPGFLNCAFLTNNGNFCKEYFNLTKKYCAKSCGFCGVECSDKPEFAHFCSSLSSHGDFCLTQSNWTKENCRKSCGFCTDTPSTTSAFKTSTSKPTLAPRTPSNEEKQKSVMLEIRDMDMKKWDKMENDFKEEVARAATEHCAADPTGCQSTSTSSRRRRASQNMIFTGDMVHILPGYPMQSPDDPQITLLAFYLEMPKEMSDSVVHRDTLSAIVKSDMSSIGETMESTIVSVVPLPTTTETSGPNLKRGTDAFKGDEEDEQSDDPESKSTNAIIGASVGGVLFLLVIIAVVVGYRKTKGFNSGRRVHSKENVSEGVVEGNEAIYEATDGSVTVKKSASFSYDNNTYVSAEQLQAVEAKRGNRTQSPKNEPATKIEEPRLTKSPELHVTTNHASVNKGFEYLEESVGKECQEKQSTPKQLEDNETASGSADYVVLGSHSAPAEVKGDMVVAKSSDEVGTEEQSKMNNKEGSDKTVEGNVVVV